MLNIIPTPKATTMANEHIAISPCVTADDKLFSAAQTLKEYALRTKMIDLCQGEGGIKFVYDASIKSEAYKLTVTSNGATVLACDLEGANHAAVTLIQLLEKDYDNITLPVGTIEDYPECSWRGVMVDLARDWHELYVLYEYVDMCCFFKLKYLHLHFTDSQSYTLPSKLFPKLPTPGRHYTEDELKGLMAYATSRGVQIVPEIDTPGHSLLFTDSYPEIFGDEGIICNSETSINAMTALFGKLCELFSDSDYIHIGGDEVNINCWTKCPRCLERFKNEGVDVDSYLETDEKRRELAELMYATFIKRICEAVLSFGKTPVVWEGFCEEMNYLIPRDAVIVSWENYFQTTPKLLDAGFRIINCAWRPMYVVTPTRYWSPEEVYNWSVYTWGAVHPESPYLNEYLVIEPTSQVEGGQLLAWGDYIVGEFHPVSEGVREEQRLLEERAPCLAQNVWTREKVLSWDEFAPKMEKINALYEAFRNNKSICK